MKGMRIRSAALLLVLLAGAWTRPIHAQRDSSQPPPKASESIAEPKTSGDSKAAGSSSEAILAYREAANYQNNGAFEVAVEEWQKFLKAHPTDPLAVKAQHYLGVCQLQLKQYQAAAAAFAAVLQKHPQFELAEDAWFNRATAQYALAAAGKVAEYQQAAESFGELLRRYPESKHREDGQFYRGEALYAQGKKSEAVSVYRQFVKQFPQSKRRTDTLYALGVALEELGDHSAAGEIYDLLLKETPDSPLAAEVRLRKAETLLQAGDVASALELFTAAAKTSGAEAADHALSRQAYCLAKLDRHAQAGEAYGRLAKQYPQSPLAADAPIAAGRSYYRANQPALARQWLEQALERGDAHSTEAAHWLCRLFIKAGEPANAEQLARQHARQASGGFAPALALDLADALYEIPSRRRDALAEYARFLKTYEDHELAAQALYSAAFTAHALQDYSQAQDDAHRFLKKYPHSDLRTDVLQIGAESSLQRKDYQAAANHFRELVKLAPDHKQVEEWQLRRGLVALLAKDFAGTATLLSPLVDKFHSADHRAEARFLIGSAQFQAGNFQRAQESLAASLQAAPRWKQADEALLLLARSQMQLGADAAADQTLQRLLSQFPATDQRAEALYRRAELFDRQQKYAEALRDYTEVVQKHGETAFAPYALYGGAWANFRTKQYGPASDLFTSLITAHADHDLAKQALLGRAMARRQAGDARAAAQDLQAFLNTSPDRSQTIDALYELGLAQVSQQEYDAAVTAFERLLKDSPDYANADKVLYEIGWAHKSAGQADEAVSAFSRLAERHPTSKLAPEAWFHVGESHYDAKRYGEAAAAYARAKSQPVGSELAEKIVYKLGWSYYQLKDYARAGNEFAQQLAEFSEGSLAGDATFMKAECLFRQEKYSAAWTAYQAALKTPASTPTIEGLTLLHAGQAAGQLKQWAKSVEVLSQLAQRQPQSPLLAEASYELGWARQNLGEIEAALADYEAAALLSRDHVGARARFMRGELLFEQKQHAAASREFQRSMYGYGDAATSEIKNWQAKSGYEAGRCAEVLLNNASDSNTRDRLRDDATRCYSFVVEKHPDHPLAREAAKRLAALKKL